MSPSYWYNFIFIHVIFYNIQGIYHGFVYVNLMFTFQRLYFINIISMNLNNSIHLQILYEERPTLDFTVFFVYQNRLIDVFKKWVNDALFKALSLVLRIRVHWGVFFNFREKKIISNFLDWAIRVFLILVNHTQIRQKNQNWKSKSKTQTNIKLVDSTTFAIRWILLHWFSNFQWWIYVFTRTNS